jgi:AAA15 family ATPase/GTPase
MLLEFSVENYLCFKNKVTFSFEADDALGEDKLYNPQSRRAIGVEGVGAINTVNAIYGKNASGKSSLLRAMWTLFTLVMHSQKLSADDDLCLPPYDKAKPVIIECKFVYEGDIWDHFLSIFTADKKHRMSIEKFKKNGEDFHQKEWATLGEKLNQLLASEISNLTLLISNFVLSGFFEDGAIFSDHHNAWYDVKTPEGLAFFKQKPSKANTYPHILMDDPIKDFLLTELKAADFNIKDYKVDKKTGEISFYHRHHDAPLGLDEQSDGTVKYFNLLVNTKLNVLDTGGMLVVDELEKALHPLLALRFIELFKDPKTNPKHARLLFTTHDTLFMHQSVLNGDQVWLMDRNDDTDETELFSPAQDVNFDPLRLGADYMHGDYGAIPKLPEA